MGTLIKAQPIFPIIIPYFSASDKLTDVIIYINYGFHNFSTFWKVHFYFSDAQNTL